MDKKLNIFNIIILTLIIIQLIFILFSLGDIKQDQKIIGGRVEFIKNYCLE